ncbi:MAG: FAD-dependent oxidoreductase [Actinobacteria bacterium]|nr:FAD-dependent oxidoreductase [Actinomycetota bacterium]
MTHLDIAPRASALPTGAADGFDVEADIVVVGGGGGGLPAALFSRWLGNDVILLEKAPQLGGTARKAAFWYWIPNNVPMRELGIEDTEKGCLKYMARLSRPQSYDPDHPTYGMTQWEYDLCRGIYQSASEATELLHEKGALVYRHCADVPDYWSNIDEDNAPKGRVLVPSEAAESMSDGGAVAVRTMSAAAERDGVDVRTGHRVQRVIVENREVVGVEAGTVADGTLRVRARKAVIFATGGFTHDKELRQNFLNVPVYGGCGANSNEGDFIRIATPVGAQLRNMQYAWMCPVPLEKAVRSDPDISGMFSVSGDSMIFVNKRGERVCNEKLPYNELAHTFFEWDGEDAEYPNLILFQIWDQRSQDHSASDEYGRLIVPEGSDDRHVIKGDTLPELTEAIADRLEDYEHVTGGLRLSEGFLETLRSTIDRFNELAAAGVDADFGRGEREISLIFNGPVKEEPGRANPTMWPISDSGPYYAALVTGGTLDTKGGPKTTPDMQVVDDTDTPIPGLFGVGNCVASPSAQAYWAGGATLGPILAMAHRAANAAHAQTVREVSAVTRAGQA